MTSSYKGNLAFVFSLIGGLVITVASLFEVLFNGSVFPYGMPYGMGHGMMGGYWFGYGSSWMLGLFVVSLICGILVLIGAIMLNSRPQEHVAWGIVVLIFAIISFTGMGGFIIGALLGIAGGAIALSYKTPSAQANPPTA